MGRLDLADKSRDEDRRPIPITEVSRAINRGDYANAIAILTGAGQGELEAERFVAVTLAINTPTARVISSRLRALVDVARRAMEKPGWTFSEVAASLELLQQVDAA